MEDRTERLIRGQVERGLYDRCFHPMRHVRKKFHGEWKDLHEKLLPGYVFIQSGRIGEVYGELRRIPMLTKVLGREENWFCALREQEAAWLELLIYDEEAVNTNREAKGNEIFKESSRGERREKTLREVCRSGDDKAVEIGLSQVQAEGETIVILSGPLKDMQGYIRKIHLHRRIAEVEVEFMGRKTVIHLGIEMVGKREEERSRN